MRNKFFGTGEAGYHPLHKLKIILAGLRFAVHYEFTFTYKLVLSLIILLPALIYRQWLDFEMILLSTGLVLIAELFNTSIEAVCDFIETRHNEKIRAIKDIAAAAVGISMVVWLTVMIFNAIHLISVISG